MANLSENDLKLFVDSVTRYFRVTTKQEPVITSAYLGTQDVEGFAYNGIVSFSGSYNGHVVVSMPPKLLRELLLLQQETDMSEGNLLDAVGEIANTLAGNARKQLGSGLEISVPITIQGDMSNGLGTRTRVRKRPFVITLKWNHQQALVCVDMERSH
jgi:chemotaxis protein CheX